MTVKQSYDVWDFRGAKDGFCIKLGENQSVLIYEGDDVLIGFLGDMVIKSITEDKALMEALGDVLIDHAMVNTVNRLCIYACVDLRRATV